MRLKDKIAVITGAGSGIGRATAKRFAREGAKVVASDIFIEGCQETVNMITSMGGEAIMVKADVSKADQIQAMVKTTLDNYGQINILFNNAGIELSASITETREEDWDRVMSTNLKGIFLCSKYAIPEMIKAGGGSIINTASIAGLVGFDNLAAYNTSKGGVITLTKNMALDYAQYNIRVNCICPGVIETSMIERLIEIWGGDPEATKQSFVALTPIGRLGTPEDIANAALFLASEESSFVTGSALVVDGGYTTR
jgi:NAD(P)-dependent dehydrogenase (short-subunit alcohol dehydrogenase family)